MTSNWCIVRSIILYYRVDLTISKLDDYSIRKWRIIKNQTGLDHKPIIFEVGHGSSSMKEIPVEELRYNTSKTNWSTFFNVFNAGKPLIDANQKYSDAELETTASQIVGAIESALEKSTKTQALQEKLLQ